MKRLLCFIALLFGVFTCSAQLSSRVDERFELTSVAFRLAGAYEYRQCGVPSYAQDIDEYFSSHAYHPLVNYIRELREEYAIGYDAVSSTAALLVIEEGHVRVNPKYRSADISAVDSRWTKKAFRRYVKLLDRFYRESGFRNFFDSHAELYRYAEGKLDALLSTMDAGWFTRYYGEDFGDPDIYIGMCNGPSNYALTEQVLGDDYGIVMGCGSDGRGMPVFNELILSIVLHEFAHNFSNPLSQEYMDEVEAAMQTIYPHVAEAMMYNAYGDWESVFGEFFNDLNMLMYYREAGQSENLRLLMRDLQNRGFVWMERAVELMDEFYADRVKYPYISDFMPRMVEFMDTVAREYDQVAEEYRSHMPHVKECVPSVGDIDSNATRIALVFSEPMMMRGMRVDYVDREDIERPTGLQLAWIDECTCALFFPENALEAGKTYGFRFFKDTIFSAEGYPLAEDYELIFTVRETGDGDASGNADVSGSGEAVCR